jgi:hypothetical protein
LIQAPAKYVTGLTPKGGLSPADKTWVAQVLPWRQGTGEPQLKVGLSQFAQAEGRRDTRVRVRTDAHPHLHIGTFGTSDTVLVLFEVTPRASADRRANDDSGTDLNAHVQMRLQKGRKYQVGVRLYYADAALETSLMVW